MNKQSTRSSEKDLAVGNAANSLGKMNSTKPETNYFSDFLKSVNLIIPL
ncbi:hypothetical protein IQ255_01225 [Pleurocapsales cyanobacterium LEGE 10410]|nr:hypothetical protein [Pleurocapsales cyanobacterium LEGE 10410]